MSVYYGSVKYITHKEMRSRVRQIKKIDTSAKLLGIDVGRRWTGLAVSDGQMLTARAFKTLELKTHMSGVQGDIDDVYRQIRNAIRSKHIKGLIVGYPLDSEGKPVKHCDYVLEFMEHFA